MQQTLEIPKERWGRFITLFNRIIADRPIRIEVIGRTIGDQEMANLLPFHGIDYDSKGSEAGTLDVNVGSDRGELSHRVVGPQKIYLLQGDAGEWLDIEEAGGVRTLIHFEHVPELQAEYPEVPHGHS
jgi:hypothetical protein